MARLLHLEHDQGENDAADNSHDDEQKVQAERVSCHAPRILRACEKFKIFKSAPWTSENAVRHFIVLKGKNNTKHGQIIENCQQRYRRKRQRQELEIILPVLCLFCFFQEIPFPLSFSPVFLPFSYRSLKMALL